jgi:Uma2 family endonuclease
MRMSTVPSRLLTEQEYLARERKSELKNEFYRGETFAMAGASREHNLIAANISRSLGNQLAERRCEVYQSDMKVRVSATGLITYPDVVVGCGELQFANDEKDVLLNPVFLTEVLSPSTAAYDCGPKAAHYRLLESLQEFLLVDQNVPFVEHYIREDNETWRVTRHEGLDATIEIPSIACGLPLSDAYAKVTFAAEARPMLRPIRDIAME